MIIIISAKKFIKLYLEVKYLLIFENKNLFKK